MNKLLRVVYVLIFSAVCSLCHADEAVIYKLVTDVSDLHEGDQIFIVNIARYDAMSNKKSTAYTTPMGFGSIGLADKLMGSYIIRKVDGMAQITLVGSSEGWYLKTGSRDYFRGYKKNSTTSYFTTTTTQEEAKCSISFSSQGNADISFASDVFLRYDTRCFRCGASTKWDPIQIYKKVDISLDGNVTTKDVNMNNITSSKDHVESFIVRRTFKNDGGWYTLCLPFALTEEDITNQFKGADFEEFSSVSQDGGSVNLKFNKVTETKAGVPYLVKPKNTVENLMFIDKMISVSEPIKVTQNINGKDYSFVGTFDPTTLPVDGTARFIGSSGVELVAPTSNGGDLKGLRAYFLFPSSGAQAKVCHGEIPTSIQFEKVDGQDAVHRIYNLNGQYVGNDQDRLQKGIYVVNGKKVVIK